MRIRKNVESLTDAEQRRLLSAVTQLKAVADPAKNYTHFASIHGHSCPHGCELFLPWHRAYIYEFESALRAFEPDVTLPYWDWTLTPHIPALFVAPLPNPLYYERYTDKERQNMPDLHPLPAKADVDDVSKLSKFLDFGGGGENTPSPGDLEVIHSWPHFWVGDTMADITFAACDPIFWAHHANVDRIWAKWQSHHPGTGPDVNPSNLQRSLDGLDTPWTVSDVINTTSAKLDYSYAVLVDYSYAVSVRDIPIERNMLTGSVVFMKLPLPTSFEFAELRIEGLIARNRAPLQLELFIHSRTPSFRIPLFGVHSHSMGASLPAGIKPCFSPGMHNNPCGRVNVRKRIPRSHFIEHGPVVDFGLGLISQRRDAITEVSFERAYIVFK